LWNLRPSFSRGPIAQKTTTPGASIAPDPLASNRNLDRKDPRAEDDIPHLPAEQLTEHILAKERRIMEIMET